LEDKSPMSSIFLPFFRGQKTSFFCCFLAQKSAQNHNKLWSNSTFYPQNHISSSLPRTQRALSV